MTVLKTVQVGDAGVVLRLLVQEWDEDAEAFTTVNISTATVKKILLKPPEGELQEHTADFATNGSDGLIQYTTVTDDLDEDGDWQIQGYVEMGTLKLHTTVKTLVVKANAG